jgi:acetyl esterase/lipase
METILNSAYSENHERNVVDLFLPDQPNGCGLFCIHGGGWGGGKKEQWHSVAQHFCELGYCAASTNYRLSGHAQYPAQIDDVRQAFSFYQQQLESRNIEVNKIAVMGSSAGGHLAAMLGTDTENAPQAAVCYCPVTSICADLLQIGTLKDSYLKLMGKPEEDAPDDYKAASPILRIDGSEPPFLFIHGDADATVGLIQSTEMAERLKNAGAHAEVEVLPGVEHGFGYGVVTDAQKLSLARMEGFLSEQFGL